MLHRRTPANRRLHDTTMQTPRVAQASLILAKSGGIIRQAKAASAHSIYAGPSNVICMECMALYDPSYHQPCRSRRTNP